MSHIEAERAKKHSLPFIALSETWLKSYISDAQLHIPGYTLSRCDRQGRIGGGVLLFSHEDIPVSSVKTSDDGVCQVLFVTFLTAKICIANVYRPPNANYSSFKKAIDFLDDMYRSLDDESIQLWLVGDFNFPNIDWPSLSVNPGGSTDATQSSLLLLNFMSKHFLNQYVSSPTRGNNILDLFLTNNEYLVTNVSSNITDLSDHNMVDVMLSFNPADSNRSHLNLFDENEFRSLDFAQADFSEVREKLADVNWKELRQNSTYEEFPRLFTNVLFQICKDCVPVKKISKTGKPRSLHALQRKKAKLKTRLQAAELGGNTQRIQCLKSSIALLCFKIKEQIDNRLDLQEHRAVDKIKSNPKFFYSYAKSFSQIKSSISMLFNKHGDIITDKSEMANILQEQFSSVYSDPNSPDIVPPDFDCPVINTPFSEHSLSFTDEDIQESIKEIKLDSASGPDGIPAVLLKSCSAELCEPIRLIWEESMAAGTVPKFYKEAYVAPLYKKDNRAQPVNYRPVSLTSHIIKTYERIVRKVMVKYIEDNEILSKKQHGFRSGRSCLTQMLSHFDDILLGFTNGLDTDSIYLDYAKAFDKVDHKLLLIKLQKYGFSSQLISWIRSFLTDRKQCVVLDGHRSVLASIISGVPQGTVLGPILFILFINDLQGCVKHSNVSFFADDTRVSKQINCQSDVYLLQEDLCNIISWSRSNNMKLHEDKFDLLIHRSKRHDTLQELPFMTECMSYHVSNGNELHPVHNLKDLGVTVSADLSWSLHIANAVSKARSKAFWILSVFKTRERSLMMTLYKSLVRSLLEYCCPLWNPSKITDIQLLESVQRTFTNRIAGLQGTHYWDRLKTLKLMSLQRRRERYIILQMWKLLHCTTPNDIGVKFQEKNRHGLKAIVPKLVKTSLQHNQSLYDASFAVLGPRLWNTIPAHLTRVADSEQFKIQLTNYLFTIPDTPPVAGYTCQNSNSLLDWNKDKSGWSDNAMAH